MDGLLIRSDGSLSQLFQGSKLVPPKTPSSGQPPCSCLLLPAAGVSAVPPQCAPHLVRSLQSLLMTRRSSPASLFCLQSSLIKQPLSLESN